MYADRHWRPRSSYSTIKPMIAFNSQFVRRAVLVVALATAIGVAVVQSRPVDTTPSAPLLASELAGRAGPAVDPLAPLTYIAFGSCSNTTLPQPLWDPIIATNPDLWVWLGDNVYGDTDNMSVMRAKYEDALAEPGYASLLTQIPVIGTWDDHDYGSNDAGSDYVARVASQKEMLDFLGEPLGSDRRSRRGVYASYVYGEAPTQTKIILLDARYHRSDPGPDGDVLGEEQWAWLEAELTGSEAQLHVIGGGFQFLPTDHPYEKWANFGQACARLFDVINRSGAPGVILLSGDRHISEIMKVEDAALPYLLYEVTSSGMTHSWSDNPGEANRYRLGELYTELGFGTLDIDWEGGQVSLQLRDPSGAVAVEQVVRLEELRAR